MAVTLGSYIEALTNPKERFRTLDGTYAPADSSGGPPFISGSRAAVFRISHGNRTYLLHCPLAMSDYETADAEKYAGQISHLGTPFLAQCRWLPGELLVYDTAGRAVRVGVLIEEEPSGEPFTSFVRSRLMRADRKPFRDLLRGLAGMDGYLASKSLVHGNLRPGNIIVREDGTPAALGYAMAREKNPQADIAGLASLAMITYIAGSEPSVFTGEADRDMFRPEALRNSAPHIRTQAEFLKIKPLAGLADALIHGNSDRSGFGKLLSALADTPFAELPLLASLLEQDAGHGIPHIVPETTPAGNNREDTTFKVDFNRCDEVCPATDAMIRFRIGGRWDFADRYGNRITREGFTDAADFYEGRAPVSADNGYGLIDRQGKYAMEPRFEMLEWYGPQNVAAACADGKWELYDREGRQLTSGGYDWLGDFSEGTILARRGNKFGYLLPDGTHLTDLRFDDAYSFRGGTATVKVGTEIYRIGPDGHKMP